MFLRRFFGKSDHILLLLIVAAGAFLRFYQCDFSLSNDELGALSRINYNSIGEVISSGVKSDLHPPLVLIFLFYWTKIAGFSETAIRTPFIICGILSIYFLYLIGRRWFNPVTGLIASAALAALEFPVMYTQIARPYSPGMLFVLMNVWWWTLLLFDARCCRWKHAVLYGISAALCIYTHYFSFLTAAITGITGLFFLNRSAFKYYATGGTIALLLFIPSFGIFHGHFFETGGLGGAEGWLGKPKPDFIFNFFLYGLNNSRWLSILVVMAALTSLVISLKKIPSYKFHLLSAAWFLVPYLTGYYYSIYRSAVLQNKVLLFSWPFALLFLFSFFRGNMPVRLKTIIISAALALFLSSTVFEKKFFLVPHFDQFREMTARIIEFCNRYGEENITRAVNVHDQYYIDFYLNRSGRPLSFASYSTPTHDSFLRFDSLCRNSPFPYFLYAWETVNNPGEIFQVIKKHYPFLLHKDYFFCAEVYFFARTRPQGYQAETPLFFSANGFEGPVSRWSGNDSSITGVHFMEGIKSVHISSMYPFSPTFEVHAEEIFNTTDDVLNISVAAMMSVLSPDVKLCLSFEQHGSSYEWHDMAFTNFIDTPGTWKNIYLFCRVPNLRSKNDRIKIFAWNMGHAEVFLDDFRVWTEKGNPLVFGRKPDNRLPL